MSKRVRFLSFLSLFLSFSLSFKLSVDLLRFILLLAGSNVIVVNDSEWLNLDSGALRKLYNDIERAKPFFGSGFYVLSVSIPDNSRLSPH